MFETKNSRIDHVNRSKSGFNALQTLPFPQFEKALDIEFPMDTGRRLKVHKSCVRSIIPCVQGLSISRNFK